MNSIATLTGSIVSRILGVSIVTLLLTVGVTAAHDQGVKIPGSGWLVPAIARAGEHEVESEETGDGEPEETSDGDGDDGSEDEFSEEETADDS